MKKHTFEFAEKICAENKVRMEREAKGDYGQPIHLVFESDEETKSNFNKFFKD